MLAIQSAVNSVRRETVGIRSKMQETNLVIMQQFGILNRNIRQIALKPTHREVEAQIQARLVRDSLNNGEDA
jgi:hypothetical protein